MTNNTKWKIFPAYLILPLKGMQSRYRKFEMKKKKKEKSAFCCSGGGGNIEFTLAEQQERFLL